MKKYILLLFAFAAFSGLAADLTTVSGKVYKNVELVKAAAGSVIIEHDKGTASIALKELPDDFIAALSPRQRMAIQSLADIKLKNGKLLKKCVIEKLGDNQVAITHLNGTVTVNFTDLPAEYRALFTRKQLEMLKSSSLKAKGSSRKGEVKPTGERTADGRIIYVGSRGGKFYINDQGRRVYLKKAQ